MLSYDNVADVQPFVKLIGFTPTSLKENLIKDPSSTQDRWHARLYFLNPLLRISLGLLWVFSGIIPLIRFSQEIIPENIHIFLFYSSVFLDILLGIATLMNWKIKWIGALQIIVIFIYTIYISIFMPAYWMDPFGAILKNIPIIMATLVMMAISEQR